jgi:hypothetical protein
MRQLRCDILTVIRWQGLPPLPSQLKTDSADPHYQHRVGAKVPIEIVLEALCDFLESG